MKTTYTAGVDLFLLNNEISIFTPNRQTMLYSTDKTYSDIGVHLLDRKMFVKGEDLEELADNVALEIWRYRPDAALEIKEFERDKECIKAGYQANKNEFTWEDMEKAYLSGAMYGNLEELIKHLRPLSLPTSVTIENNEIIEVKWI